MDLSLFFERSKSEGGSSGGRSSYPRSVLYKRKGLPKRVPERVEERRGRRQANIDRLRGIEIIQEEEEEEEDKEGEEEDKEEDKEEEEEKEEQKKQEAVERKKQEAVERPRRKASKAQDEQSKILHRLAEFRLRKKRQKDLEAKGKKPVFKVGYVHHKPYPFEAPPEATKRQTSEVQAGGGKTRSQKGGGDGSDGSTKTVLEESYVIYQEDNKVAPMEQEGSNTRKTSQGGAAKENQDILPNCQTSQHPKTKGLLSTTTAPATSNTPQVSPSNSTSQEVSNATPPKASLANVDDALLFKTPLQPLATPSSRSSRRKSTVSPLLDGLRKDICFNRGSSSDHRRAKKGLPPKLTSPFESFVQEIDHQQQTATTRKVLFNDHEEEEEAVLLKTSKDMSTFRDIYKEAIDKLTALADTWDKEVIPDGQEELLGRISAIVGKARLLMGRKGRLEQFKTLTDNCEFSIGEKETNAEDLKGFWDMISYQIEGIYSEFEELKALKARDWKEKALVSEAKPKEEAKALPKKKDVRPKGKASSGLRAMLKAKRSQMTNSHLLDPTKIKEDPSAAKNFDGGFFQVASPIRSSASPKVLAAATPTAPPTTATTPKSSSSYLRKSILMSSVMRVSSSARRSLSTPLINEPLINTTKKPTPSRRLTTAFLGAEQQPPTTGDLLSFETPEAATPRRSKRLSTIVTPRSYKE